MEERFIYIEERPWGKFTTLLAREKFKVKEIEVNPGHRLSYQSHSKREEVWVVVEGEATVTLDGIEHQVLPGENVKITVGTKHRVENRANKKLKFIEVQTGTYFGEDDIVRYEDDYGREKNGK